MFFISRFFPTTHLSPQTTHSLPQADFSLWADIPLSTYFRYLGTYLVSVDICFLHSPSRHLSLTISHKPSLANHLSQTIPRKPSLTNHLSQTVSHKTTSRQIVLSPNLLSSTTSVPTSLSRFLSIFGNISLLQVGISYVTFQTFTALSNRRSSDASQEQDATFHSDPTSSRPLSPPSQSQAL